MNYLKYLSLLLIGCSGQYNQENSFSTENIGGDSWSFSSTQNVNSNIQYGDCYSDPYFDSKCYQDPNNYLEDLDGKGNVFWCQKEYSTIPDVLSNAGKSCTYPNSMDRDNLQPSQIWCCD